MKYGYIYKISYGDLNYYGSSIKTPKERYNKHNADRRCSSKIIFEEAEKNNEKPSFEVLGCFYTTFCKECRRKEEQKYIDNNPCVNIQSAYSQNPQKEYVERNPERNRESKDKYYQANRERIIEERRIAYQEGRVKSKWADLSREEKDAINARKREARKLKKEQSV